MLPASEQILPPPFAWIPIPAGQVTLGTFDPEDYLSKLVTFDVPAFEIAQYPLTNAQFEKFIQAGGYEQQRWWTDRGWQTRERGDWQWPHGWQDSILDRPDHPVVAVGWYEAVAFCLWLSDVTGENIMLPTEQQWQRAAQGDDHRTYPWGQPFRMHPFGTVRCNSSIDAKSDGTTPVTRFEGKGDSPFGVVDMCGNVWEWCRTDYATGTQDIHELAEERILRGGSWRSNSTSGLRVVDRIKIPQSVGDPRIGFRLARSW